MAKIYDVLNDYVHAPLSSFLAVILSVDSLSRLYLLIQIIVWLILIRISIVRIVYVKGPNHHHYRHSVCSNEFKMATSCRMMKRTFKCVLNFEEITCFL